MGKYNFSPASNPRPSGLKIKAVYPRNGSKTSAFRLTCEQAIDLAELLLNVARANFGRDQIDLTGHKKTNHVTVLRKL
ncbi:MAG: hypothetical protein ACXABY_03330 [Candidatus Thorarchaeota archaeon]|jgi:hypothetical protein